MLFRIRAMLPTRNDTLAQLGDGHPDRAMDDSNYRLLSYREIATRQLAG
jgi:hypothetical protein